MAENSGLFSGSVYEHGFEPQSSMKAGNFLTINYEKILNHGRMN
jgi:hypothetical protein